MSSHLSTPCIILASGSPRRHALLGALARDLVVKVSDVDETAQKGELPAALVERLSLAKAVAVQAILDNQLPGDVVLAADTIVVAPDGAEILGKPRDADEATAMLHRLRGRQHTVYTGIALVELRGERHSHVRAVATPVLMRDYADDELDAYVATGDPLDKAGSYAIQHDGFAPVARFDGCYANVMGLPLCHVYGVLAMWGYGLDRDPLGGCPYPKEHGGRCPWARSILVEYGK